MQITRYALTSRGCPASERASSVSMIQCRVVYSHDLDTDWQRCRMRISSGVFVNVRVNVHATFAERSCLLLSFRLTHRNKYPICRTNISTSTRHSCLEPVEQDAPRITQHHVQLFLWNGLSRAKTSQHDKRELIEYNASIEIIFGVWQWLLSGQTI